ncbi:MAG: hypothetical protein ACPGVU_23455 [Limisphaerales bacterium]
MKVLSGLLLLVMICAFFVPMEFPVNTEYWRTLMDVSHLPFFAIFTLASYPFFADRDLPHEKKCKYAFGIAAVVSIAVELLQPSFGRSQSMIDQVYGLTGALFGMFLLLMWPRRDQKQAVAMAAVMTLVFLAVTIGPAWRKYQIIQKRAADIPSLGSFEDVDQLQLWRPNYYSFTGHGHYNLITNMVSQGSFALEVDAALVESKQEWPGVSYDAGDLDWSGYDALAFDLYNPTDDFLLRLRIDDDGDCSVYESRFNLERFVDNGWNNISIPLSEIENAPPHRKMNLQAIRRVLIFISGHDAPRKFFLDNVRLTRNAP